jgi:DNA-binding FrmR family transcriptional regulator
MGHTTKYKQKLTARMKRIRGQMDAVERALDNGTDCAEVLQLIAASRGAMNGLMAELIEGHLRHHVLEPEEGEDPREAADELMDVIRRYLK